MQVIIAGNDLVAYGEPRTDGQTWREEMLETLDLDLDRIHFTGLIPLDALRGLFRLSRAHVYLTVPFVLSWSMMEAMATGTPIVASRTEPVEEMIRHEHEGLLFDFFDVAEQAGAIERMLDDPALRRRTGQAARARMVAEYDKPALVQQQWELMQSVASGDLNASNEVLTLSELSHD
jgi:glycosyltransferase involved in cell wall biosynthesis